MSIKLNVIFTKRRHLTPLQFSVNNRSIDVVQHFNYLGIMLDENMSWKTHIAMVRNKLSRINGILHRLKYYFPRNILITLYKSLFTPHINYKYATLVVVSEIDFYLHYCFIDFLLTLLLIQIYLVNYITLKTILYKIR